MYDRFNRHINYLRISVTDRCNLKCTYCMPECESTFMDSTELLSFAEIVEVVKIAVELGISKIRLTGGEPLVRKNICHLVELINQVPGIEDLALTTNGLLLEQFAQPLKRAGLKRVNISLDTLDPKKFFEITRGGDLQKVLNGIVAAKQAGLEPVKLNCVVFKSSNENDAQMVKAFGIEQDLQVRFIRQMNLETGEFSIVEGGDGGNCSKCNRLRLTSSGMVKPCLFSEYEYSVRQYGAKQALLNALQIKPQRGCYNRTGSFYNIGG